MVYTEIHYFDTSSYKAEKSEEKLIKRIREDFFSGIFVDANIFYTMEIEIYFRR